MREIWVADCETDPFKKGRTHIKPFIWGAYNGTIYKQFNSTKQFLNFITQQDAIVYAHNGGKFDWYFLLDQLSEFDPLTIINGRLAKFVIGLCEFRDSYNILPVPLSAYKKDDIDYAIMEKSERDKPTNRRKIERYLRKDCQYLYEIVKEFIDNYGLNITLASSAFKQWRKIAQIKAPKTSAQFYSDLSPFYFGGRVEVFQPGIIAEQFKIIDINSAYPFAMMQNHPYGNEYIESKTLPNTDAYIARSFITTTCHSRGAFPFREKDKSLVFPNDGKVRQFNITGWEYLAARDTGALSVHTIDKVITFPDSINFAPYVEHFYNLKANSEKDTAAYIIAKLFLNSLYGKFGANPAKYSEYTIVKPCHIDAACTQDDYDFCGELGPWALLDKPIPEHKQIYYHVAVAASVTGFVRAYLWRALNQCQGAIYCDTDSIMALDTGTLELDPKKLGAWDIEAVCDYGAFAGKKLYAARYLDDKDKWKTASKGVRLDYKEIIRVAQGETIKYMALAPTFSLKRGISICTRNVKMVL